MKLNDIICYWKFRMCYAHLPAAGANSHVAERETRQVDCAALMVSKFPAQRAIKT
jgi:hypothetical protein